MFGPETLLLFDIDGTLLGGMPPMHRQAIIAAAQEVFHLTLSLEQLRSTAGRTDTSIAYTALLQAGLERREIAAALPAFFREMAAQFERLRLADLSPYLLPHVEPTLAWLERRGVALGLVTGNLTEIAWSKLRAAGIGHYFHCGAFGEEAEARDTLPALAAARARACFGRAFLPSATFVIGDTPFDIACGLACGFRTIAVATGRSHSFEELDGHGPDLLLRHLGELPGSPFAENRLL
ncbi:MAG TPA: HAD hydrolase-like protein [Ktedonobacterales bacterium]|jgi:phosphoglycolate phosphatase-like HAD superfamily hydrolase